MRAEADNQPISILHVMPWKDDIWPWNTYTMYTQLTSEIFVLNTCTTCCWHTLLHIQLAVKFINNFDLLIATTITPSLWIQENPADTF